MRLSSQNLPDIENVSESDIDRAFENGAIGKFAHLWASNDSFIQAGSRGTPSSCLPPDDPEVRDRWAFIHRTGSEPWVLEHIDLVGVREYEASRNSRWDRSDRRSAIICGVTRRGGIPTRGYNQDKVPCADRS